MIRVLIADDEALMRAGIRLILDTADDITVVAEVADGRAAVSACREADVALLDIRMPGGDGLTAAAEIVRLGVHVVMLTTFGEDSYVASAMRAGATGFLLKDTPPADLIHAVRVAASGELILAPQITRRLVEQHLAAPSGSSNARELVRQLTDTERGVLRLVGAGMSNAEIAAELFMGAGTVKAHISRILPKLDCANRVQAAIVAHDSGLLGS
ncbi:response regulator transcription factor [Lentzea tibetensis]|uniref:Response regulator transcription factor n=1 Tax=Lentzea tibetensis TaxID=2591470 RepID=A0A563EIM0_9PSEU|nr:response regulator transcription factor [Lentzea tibetensis]TWP46445.1 response regulator transcription factor [Lentzea tibetensis]